MRPGSPGAHPYESQARRRVRNPASRNAAPAARKAGPGEAVLGNFRADSECGAGGAGACATSTGEVIGALAAGAGAGAMRAGATDARTGAGSAVMAVLTGASTGFAVAVQAPSAEDVAGAVLVLAELAAVLEKSTDLRSMISPARFLARRMSM